MRYIVFFLAFTTITLFAVGCKKDKVPSCPPKAILFSSNEKIKGVNFDSSTDFTTDTIFNSVLDVNAEWVSIIPFGRINSYPYEFTWSHQSGYWGYQDIGVEQLALYAKSRGLKTMFKPQVQIDWGNNFTGTYTHSSESEWVAFENDFRQFTLHYAQMAANTNADMYCIGTEWKTFALTRPLFWRSLVKDVKSIYSGSLTYASNWDEYLEIPFWDDLDIIGVNAYFTISASQTPSIAEITSGWEEHRQLLEQFSCDQGKQIIFTEYGYRSTNNCAFEPWDTEYTLQVPENFNPQGQANAFEGLYQTLWSEPWFAGGFVWKWFAKHNSSGGVNENRFTPQNKEAEGVIEEYYGKF
jgi:hypothetical protein